MKILFFLALLANLVFFLWHYNAGAFHHAADKTELAAPKTKQIWLLSELEKKPPVNMAATHIVPLAANLTAPATVMTRAIKDNPQHLVTSTVVNPVQTPVSSVTTPATTAPVKTFYCYQVKGFADKTAVTHWAQQHAVDLSVLQLKETPPVVADYMVNYPAAPTIVDSKKNIALLKEHGINDFFMINHGELQGAISLGVFKAEAYAIKAQQDLIQRGIKAKVTKRYKTAASVSAQIKTAKNKPELLAALAGQAAKPSVELLPQCE